MAVIHDQRFFLRALTGADVGIGESYMDGDWTTPDLVSLVRVVVRNLRTFDAANPLLSGVRSLASRFHHNFRANTLSGSRHNIREHYDLGDKFYDRFLDSRLIYSCAYFRSAADSLETAQAHKLDLGTAASWNLSPVIAFWRLAAAGALSPFTRHATTALMSPP